jgi:hypothetical protein
VLEFHLRAVLYMLPLAAPTGAEIWAGRGNSRRRGHIYAGYEAAQEIFTATCHAHRYLFSLYAGPREDRHAAFGVAPNCIATVGHVAKPKLYVLLSVLVHHSFRVPVTSQ